MDKFTQDYDTAFYRHLFKRHGRRTDKGSPRWRGLPVIKYPHDLILYAEAIFANKPAVLVETGTRFGGSAAFFADIMALVGGQVVTVDILDTVIERHPAVTYITGPSTDKDVLAQVRQIVGLRPCMVSLDSDHSRRHVKRELRHYADIATSGQFIVVEDISNCPHDSGPGAAVDWFLARDKRFARELVTDKFQIGITRDGWLRKR